MPAKRVLKLSKLVASAHFTDRMCNLVRLLLVAASLCFSNYALAALIYIDGKAGGAVQHINAGTYKGELIGGAWNAWNGSTGNGTGWLNNWGASLPGGGNIWQGTGIYNSPVDAFKAAQTIYFKVPVAGNMIFTNGDPKQYLSDNVGGTTISITKSLGSAKKDAWNLTTDVAGFASKIATFVALGLTAIAVAPVGSILGFLAAITALGLAGVGLAILGAGGPLSSGGILKALLSVKALIIKAVSASYLGQAILSTGFLVGLLGLGLTAVSMIAAVNAADPPNFNYTSVPTLQAPLFDDGQADGKLANAVIRIVDAGQVNIDAFEKYQGAVLDGSQVYAGLQLQVFIESRAALAGSIEYVRDHIDDAFSGGGGGVIDLSANKLAAIEQLFLATELSIDVLNILTDANVSVDDFKKLALDSLNNGPKDLPMSDAVYFIKRGFDVSLSNAQGIELPSSTVDEPNALTLLALCIFASFVAQRRHRLNRRQVSGGPLS